MVDKRVFRIADDAAYRRWIAEFEGYKGKELEFLEERTRALSFRPDICVAPLDAGRASDEELSAFRRRLDAQIYRNWRLYQPDDPGGAPASARIAEETARKPRLLASLLRRFASSDDASDAPAAVLTPDAVLAAAEGADFVLPLPLDAVLPPHALAHLVLALAEAPGADIVYADEDRLRQGRRSRPCFKTDWDPFFVLGGGGVGYPTLLRSEAVRRAKLEGLWSATVDNLLHAVTLSVSRATSSDKIVHVPAVLCHRAKKSDWSGAEARRLVAAHLCELGVEGVELSPLPEAPQWSRVRFSLPDPAPFVSVIIPTRDRADLLGRCASSLLRLTAYPSFEVIVIDNGSVTAEALALIRTLEGDSRVKVLREDRPFNYSLLNNLGARAARGDILVLLNNDTEILRQDWLTELASLASRPEIGAVGAKLLYPDLRVQHAGVSFGPNYYMPHQMRLARQRETGPNGELAVLRSVSAATGACLAIRKQLFLEAGGLDEERLKVAYNDIDLCRRVAGMGFAIVWTPFVELVHHEAGSRGPATTPQNAAREASELAAFWSMNPEFYENPDPFYNPQIEFKHECVDFARPPRRHRFRGCGKPSPVPFLY